MGRVIPDTSYKPERQPHIGYELAGSSHRVGRENATRWGSIIRGLVCGVGISNGLNIALAERFEPVEIRRLLPHDVGILDIRYYQPDDSLPDLTTEDVVRMREGLRMGWKQIESGYRATNASPSLEYLHAVGTLLLPPKDVEVPIGTLWLPGPEDLAAIQ